MQPTNLMFNELALVMSTSHWIWGHPADEGPGDPPEPVPVMMINMIGRADAEGDFVSYAPEPTNDAGDLAYVAEWIPSPGICFRDGGDPLNEGDPFLEECTWNTVLLRWEFTHMNS